MYIITESPVFSSENRALQLNNEDNQYLIPIVARRDVPRLISTPRENFQFVFEGLVRKIMIKPQVTPK